jgi:hypothetical protein
MNLRKNYGELKGKDEEKRRVTKRKRFGKMEDKNERWEIEKNSTGKR